MTTTQFHPPATPAAEDVFAAHTVCLTCGYDLFGQPRDGACPECGTDVAASALGEHFLARPGVERQLRDGTLYLLSATCLCGSCPVICLLACVQPKIVTNSILMTVFFFTTCAFAAIGDAKLAATVEPHVTSAILRRRVADVLAGIGLLVINAAAYAIAIGAGPFRNERGLSAAVSLGFFLLAATAWRAVPAGCMHAAVVRRCGVRKVSTVGLGYAKAFYETLWLSSIWIGLAIAAMDEGDHMLPFMVVAFLGLLGFAFVWIAMIVVHATLFIRIRRALAPKQSWYARVGSAAGSKA